MRLEINVNRDFHYLDHSLFIKTINSPQAVKELISKIKMKDIGFPNASHSLSSEM